MLYPTAIQSESGSRPTRRLQHRAAPGALAWLAILCALGTALGCGDGDPQCGDSCTTESDCPASTSCIETAGGAQCLPNACQACERVCRYSKERIGTTDVCDFDGCQ
jgi:hypothetical protein